jgi:hypothetical protein
MVIPTPILVGVPLLGLAALVWWEWSKGQSAGAAKATATGPSELPPGSVTSSSPYGSMTLIPPAGGWPAAKAPAPAPARGPIVFQAPAGLPPIHATPLQTGPQSITSLTLDASNLNPPPIKTYSGVFTVYSPPVQGNTGGGYINSATSNPAALIPFVDSPASSLQIFLTAAGGTASVTWYDGNSGQTVTTNLQFV